MTESGLSSISILVISSLSAIILLNSLLYFQSSIKLKHIAKESRNELLEEQQKLYQEIAVYQPDQKTIGCTASDLCFLQKSLILDFQKLKNDRRVIYQTGDLNSQNFRLDDKSILIHLGNLKIERLNLGNLDNYIIIAAGDIEIDQVESYGNPNLHLFSYWSHINLLTTGLVKIYKYYKNQPNPALKTLLGDFIIDHYPLGLKLGLKLGLNDTPRE